MHIVPHLKRKKQTNKKQKHNTTTTKTNQPTNHPRNNQTKTLINNTRGVVLEWGCHYPGTAGPDGELSEVNVNLKLLTMSKASLSFSHDDNNSFGDQVML